MKKAIKIFLPVFLLWFFYRLLFPVSESIDELLAKPLIFVLLPLFILKTKKLPGFENKQKVTEDLFLGVALGFVFAFTALLVNKLKHGSFFFNPVLSFQEANLLIYLCLSLVSGFSEEILGRGFLFNILRKNKTVFASATASSFLFLLLHLPIVVSQLHFQAMVLVVFLISVFLLSMVNCYLYDNRGSLVLPILIHLFWNMTIALYL